MENDSSAPKEPTPNENEVSFGLFVEAIQTGDSNIYCLQFVALIKDDIAACLKHYPEVIPDQSDLGLRTLALLNGIMPTVESAAKGRFEAVARIQTITSVVRSVVFNRNKKAGTFDQLIIRASADFATGGQMSPVWERWLDLKDHLEGKANDKRRLAFLLLTYMVLLRRGVFVSPDELGKELRSLPALNVKNVEKWWRIARKIVRANFNQLAALRLHSAEMAKEDFKSTPENELADKLKRNYEDLAEKWSTDFVFRSLAM